ncbi:hypothetical protein ACG5V6_22255 [Streptomyces chitinivorans]|uniref:Uncharacterized protein n=1 Tax=Streptomyces chitinivorans TaxID=1257027 RepID=A0ABW7HYH2_9ACTN|nr:hypothetical protein [Streptomyces chitinivorans]MDH2410935.1 hypothetical protein [Streptomyces chitinivorans]
MSTRAHGGPRRDGTRGAALVMTVFGTVWWLSGATALHGFAGPAALVGGPAVGVLLFALALRRLNGVGEQAAYERAARRFHAINLLQALAVVAVIVVANRTGALAWIPGAIAVVVGVHFLPLAPLFGMPVYRWTGALLIGAGLAGCWVALAGGGVETTRALVCLACAAVLWAAAARLVRAAALTGRTGPSVG